jgi:hypothetical protein
MINDKDMILTTKEETEIQELSAYKCKSYNENMSTNRKKVAKQRNLRYWSSLTPKQKDNSSKMISSLLAKKYPTKYLEPTLWKVLCDVSFQEIMDTKNKADEFCKGYCFEYNDGIWLPLTVKDI